MKKIAYLLSFVIIAGFVVYAGCNGDENGEPELTEQQERAQALSGTWNAQEATSVPDNVDPTIIDNLSITFNVDASFNPASFSATGAADFFSTSSSSAWDFSGDVTISSITLTDVSPVTGFTISNFSNTNMTIQFSHPGLRIASLEGTYAVSMVKQ